MLNLKFIPKAIREFFTNAVISMVEYREKTNTSREDFLQMMIDQKNNGPEENRFSMSEVLGNAFGFFVAGFETSSITMSFCLFELAHNQKVQDKVRKEIKKVFNKYNGVLTYEALADLQYLECVINGKCLKIEKNK